MGGSDGDDGRPAKKAKTEATENLSKSKQTPKWRGQQIEYKRQARRAQLDHPQPESAQHRRDRELFGIDEGFEEEFGLKPLHDEGKQKLRKLHVPKMFSQPSVMATGDKGIFVTCDKGREKKCLTDLADLVEEYLENHDFIPAELVDPDALLKDRLDRQQKKTATVHVDNEESPVEEEEIDIESSINAELSGMNSKQDPGARPAKDSPVKIRAFQLITLDVPCVSFLRFIPNEDIFNKVDVVDLVHSICADAAKLSGTMRSRYIKRLSPVVWLGKTLSDGLEKACEATLPAVFTVEANANDGGSADEEKGETATRHGVKFAIRPTTRNNDKFSRDDAIKQIATEVQRLGNNQHKVDLKHYEKGILVEVYRGWIGMSVVDNATSSDDKEEKDKDAVGPRPGYEALKRFNLAEIYAEKLMKAGKGDTKSGETDRGSKNPQE